MSDTPRTPDPGSHRHLPESQRLRQPLPAEAEIVLTGADLSIADVEAVARGGQRVRLGDDARARMAEARSVVERLVAAGEIVYGVTTGFGDLATTVIDPADSVRLQENLLVSHAVGVGEPLPPDVVRAMLLLRANTLALGHRAGTGVAEAHSRIRSVVPHLDRDRLQTADIEAAFGLVREGTLVDLTTVAG